MRTEPIDPKTARKFESYIGWNQTWWNYYIQYKQGVDELVDLVAKGKPIDTISLPLIFMLRHSLELGIKANILKLRQLSPTPPKFPNTHNLQRLFKMFENLLAPYTLKLSSDLQKQTTERLNVLCHLVDKLHKLDEGSFNFRYPVDTKDDQVFVWSDKLFIADIVNQYYDTQVLLLYLEAVLIEEGIIGNPN